MAMQELSELFSVVCGQNPAHSWGAGGVCLPVCQRCTGLYAGAAAAAFLHLSLKPIPSGRFLWVHGLFLLVMAPFGFHWVSHGAAVRGITGFLFGAASLTFLSLSVTQQFQRGDYERLGSAEREVLYFAILSGMAVLLPIAGRYGGAPVHGILTALCCAGAIAFIGVIVAGLAMGLFKLSRLIQNLLRTNQRA